MKRTEKQSWTGIGLMAIAAFILTMFMIAAPAQAVVDCSVATSTDTDGDGFTDVEECTGLTVANGAAIDFPGCPASGLSRGECLDPDTIDLFVIIVPSSPSNIPTNPLQYVAHLGATAHIITPNMPNVEQIVNDRIITPAQRAVRITESLSTSGETLGFANYGTPNGLDFATVYTERIKNHVNSVYAAEGQTPPAGLIETYIRHTIAHEIGHMTSLTKDYTARFGGNHYKSGTGVVMDQSVKYTVKGSTITFYVGTDFATPDIVDAVYH